MKKHSGFTLIEVLVAATIIAVLASVAVTSYSTATKNSRDAKRKTDLANMASALELYRADNALYPAVSGIASFIVSGGGPNAILNTALVSVYISAIPSDPKPTGHVVNTNYKYTNNKGGVASNTYQYCMMAILENSSNGNGDANTNPCNYAFGANAPGYNYFIPSP